MAETAEAPTSLIGSLPSVEADAEPSSTTGTPEERGPKAGGTPAPSQEDPSGPDKTAATAEWLQAFSPTESKRLERYKSLEDVAKAYLNLESKLGNATQIPGPDAKPEDWKAFHVKLGVPEKPEGYELKTPSEQDGWSKELETEARSMFHKLGYTPTQAQAAIDFHVKLVEKEAGKLAEDAKANTVALRKEWGEDFDRRWKLAAVGINELFGPEALNLLKYSPLGNSLSFIKSMAEYGSERTNSRTARGDLPGTTEDVRSELTRIRAHDAFFDAKHPLHAGMVQKAFELEERLVEIEDRAARR
jgi:hypothetical protein